MNGYAKSAIRRNQLKPGDPVLFGVLGGGLVAGTWLGLADKEIALVKVGDREVRVARTAIMKRP